MDTEQGTPFATGAAEAALTTTRSGRRTPLRPRNDFSAFIRTVHPPRQNRSRLNRNAVGGADEGRQWHDTDKHSRIER